MPSYGQSSDVKFEVSGAELSKDWTMIETFPELVEVKQGETS